MNWTGLLAQIIGGRPGSVIVLFSAWALLLGIYKGMGPSPVIEGMLQNFSGALLAALSMSAIKSKPTDPEPPASE